MPKSFLLHTISLVLAAAGVYIWVSTPALYSWTLQLVAALLLLYAAIHWYGSRNKSYNSRKNTIPLDLTVLTSMILLLVTETGGPASPFFFFLFFLLFAVALIYEIQATLVLTGVLILYFFMLPLTNLGNLTHLSQIFALLMITPLAIFTGHQYEQVLESRKSAAVLAQHLSREENDTLVFLSLNLKTTLLSSLDSLSLIIPKTPLKEARANLQLLYQDLKNLYRSADELQQLIDQETDKS